MIKFAVEPFDFDNAIFGKSFGKTTKCVKVHAGKAQRISEGLDVRRNVTIDFESRTDKAVCADDAVLCDASRSADVCKFTDLNVTAELHSVRNDGAFSDFAIMRDVDISHEQHIVFDDGFSRGCRCAVERCIFADRTVCADFKRSLFAAKFLILGDAAENCAVEHMRSVSDPDKRQHMYAGFQHDVFADFGPGIDKAPRPNAGAVCDFGFGAHVSGRMNHSGQNNKYILRTMLSICILGVLSSLYAALFLIFSVGLLRAKKTSGKMEKRWSVSVIVPLRNEEDHAQKTLEALAAQDYEGEWEVICVDDRSTDSTASLLQKFSEPHPKFSVVSVPKDAPFIESPKKRALETGFKSARYEILMTMDADCLPPKGWIRSMASRFEGNIAIVQGPKKNSGTPGIVHDYQKLETLGYTSIEAAGFSLGMPLVASAAALAYKKELFFRVGGFGDLVHLSSGDDDMLVHKMIQQPGVGFCYNLDRDAVVETSPVDSFRGLLNQRARWASNGTSYTNHLYTFFLTLIYTFYVWLFVSPWLALFLDFPWSWFAVPFAVKVAVDILFLSIGAIRLGETKLLRALPMTEILQVPIITVAVPLGIFKLFRWK